VKKWFILILITSFGTSAGIGVTLVQASGLKTEANCEIKAQEVLGEAAAVIGSQRRKLNIELLDETQQSLNKARKCMRPDQIKIDQSLTRVLGRIRAEVLYDIPVCEGPNTPVKGCTADGWPLNLAPPQQQHICNAGLWGTAKKR
jgi:hypothetical protein